MKKISLFLFIFLVLFLSSCESVDNDSKIQEFKAYSAYLEKDIISADQFKDVMNHFTYEIVPAVFDIRSEVRDAKTFDIIETITGSGIAIKIESPYVIILTSASFAHEVGENIISYHITDRNGNVRIGTLIRSSEDSGLALIQFYLAPGFIGFPPLRWSIRQVNLNEPVVLLGYQYHIKNAMTMGLVSNVSENQSTFETTIITDQAGLGGALFSLAGFLVGMQTRYDPITNTFQITSMDAIREFLEEDTEVS
jgi:S1-C subfamily serine protease